MERSPVVGCPHKDGNRCTAYRLSEVIPVTILGKVLWMKKVDYMPLNAYEFKKERHCSAVSVADERVCRNAYKKKFKQAQDY